jgi:hypothetical protein
VRDRNTVRRISPSGAVSTIAGQPAAYATVTGPLPGVLSVDPMIAIGPMTASERMAISNSTRILNASEGTVARDVALFVESDQALLKIHVG